MNTITARELEALDLKPPRQLVPGIITSGLNILAGNPKSGKALALGTSVPTPSGPRTMGDLKVGDLVFGPNGQPTEVIAATEAMHDRPCYKVRFDDGTTVVADADHQWRTTQRRLRHSSITTTRDMRVTLTASGHTEKFRRWNHKIPASAPPEYPEALLPIDPYCLGVWLGDGVGVRAEITIADRDAAILTELAARGVPLSKRKYGGRSCQAYGLSAGRGGNTSIQATMRSLGLLEEKHIPDAYFTAARNQRADLLRGIVDTDGHVGEKGNVEITFMCKRLARDTVRLVRSLGHIPRMSQGEATLGGVRMGPKYRIRFLPTGPDPVATVAFKADRLREPTARAGARRVVAVEPTPSVPVRCIQVARPDGLFLVTESHVITHNSFLSLGIALALTNGKPALNRYPIDKTGVLYLALEDTRYRIRSRIRGLAQPPNDLLHFSTELPRLGDGGLDQIDHFLNDHPEIGMVVIDTLAKVADPKTGSNVYEEDAALGGALHALAHHHDVAFLVVHHTRKAAAGDFLHAVSGSAGFTGTADVVIVLTRVRGENHATLEITGRDILESKLNLEWVSTAGGWIAPSERAQYAPTPRYHA